MSTKSARADLIVVGAGIAGLAHALAAARVGRRVTVFERSDRARGASVRNFGAVWPIGQPRGRMLELALRSRAIWLEIARETGLWCRPCGSVFLAHSDEELAVVREFAERGPAWGFDVDALSPASTMTHCSHANPDNLAGSLFSRTELRIDAREALPAIARFLADAHRVEFHFSTVVTEADDGGVTTANGDRFEAAAVIVASGDDFRSLYPDAFAAVPGLTRCKLHMMRTTPQRAGFDLGPHVAGGLSLRHYASFAELDATAVLRDQVAAMRPELDRYGVHVMASQTAAGELILGDSHEYADDHSAEYSETIHRLILGEAERMLTGVDLCIAGRWLGYYATATEPDTPMVLAPSERVRCVLALGGAGMTVSFALAEQVAAGLGLTHATPASITQADLQSASP